MIRVGTSWRGSHGRRYWISAPLWAFGLGGWLYLAFWLSIGIPLALLWYGSLFAVWATAQLILLLVSLVVTVWALAKISGGWRVRPLVRGLPYGLIVLDWELQGRR